MTLGPCTRRDALADRSSVPLTAARTPPSQHVIASGMESVR
jgi:hypothetical protein